MKIIKEQLSNSRLEDLTTASSLINCFQVDIHNPSAILAQ